MEKEKNLRARQRWLGAIAGITGALTAAIGTALASKELLQRFLSPLNGPQGPTKFFEFAAFVLPVALAISVALAAWLSETRRRNNYERLEDVEDKFRQNPEKPQLAWDLARTTLESYLNRNLGQTVWIFWLTILVMAAGFSVVVFGIMKSFEHPMGLAISIVSSASGIIISFLGASFLLIYRSVAQQTRSYVSILERINAVGMAVQVLTTISDDAKELRNQATVTLAKQLLDLYAGDNRQSSWDRSTLSNARSGQERH